MNVWSCTSTFYFVMHERFGFLGLQTSGILYQVYLMLYIFIAVDVDTLVLSPATKTSTTQS